jgi:VIT1/CCC1 family predicted Fe2+/Mn2+ transporter
VAEEELRGFASERRAAALLRAGATAVGALLPVIAVVFYLAVPVTFIAEPILRTRIRARRATQPG